MLKVVVAGCAGRMGKSVVNALFENRLSEVGAGFEAEGNLTIGKDIGLLCGLPENGISVGNSVETIKECSVLIDFTSPDCTIKNVEFCVANKISMVIATTGLSETQKEMINEASTKIAIVIAPNMGVGINVLLGLVKKVASLFSDDYDIEIVEMHHNKKKDAPSGTALGLAEAVADGRSVKLEDKAVYGREGLVGARVPGEIGIHALRGGDIIGEHKVIFAGAGEKVEISHSVITRDVFAKGSVRAALFLESKKNGMFDMQNVLGLKE